MPVKVTKLQLHFALWKLVDMYLMLVLLSFWGGGISVRLWRVLYCMVSLLVTTNYI
jgi:hypothetical protein